MKIADGKGTGYEARVDTKNRLHSYSIAEQEYYNQNVEGKAYNLNTGLISITGDATLCYFYNGEEEDFILQSIALGSFTGITHSGTPYLTVIKNPTGGNLISDATTTGVINQNRNFGSSLTLAESFFYKGKVSGTVTGGSDIALLQVTPAGRSFYTIDLVLPKGSSVAIKLTAAVSSGSANYYAALIGYLKDEASKD
jgi:hypothetical protein